MSLAAVGLVLGHFAVYEVVRQTDEGTPAHLFQLLLAGQAPFVAVFALRWLPRTPGPGLSGLRFQAVAAFAAFLSVIFLT